MQALYDYTAGLTVATEGNSQRLQTAQTIMPQLHVTGFDAEQIWLQLDMASAHIVRRAKRLLKKAGNEPELLTPEMDEDLEGGPTHILVLLCLDKSIQYSITHSVQLNLTAVGVISVRHSHCMSAVVALPLTSQTAPGILC